MIWNAKFAVNSSKNTLYLSHGKHTTEERVACIISLCLVAKHGHTMIYTHRKFRICTLEDASKFYDVGASAKMTCFGGLMQIDRPYKVDRDTMRYLFDLLKKLNGGCKPDCQVKEKDSVYVQLAFAMTSLNLTRVQAQQLFTPLTLDVNFLICRQIVRELGEVTNLRACGIVATADNIIEITIPKAIWKNLIS